MGAGFAAASRVGSASKRRSHLRTVRGEAWNFLSTNFFTFGRHDFPQHNTHPRG
jgi:hypothetical protein